MSRLPNRVLDVRGSSLESDVKLYLTSNEAARYLCLSYCWGTPASPIMTTRTTLSNHTQGISYGSLPRTFQDAIKIARLFNVHYLWIDSLCIIQGDAEDWRNEASRMAEIYENSYFTIAATASTDSNGGCFRSVPLQDQDLEFQYTPKNARPFPIYFRASIVQLKYGELGKREHPLIGRAWVFQERALSPRMIHFCRRELLFECNQDYKCQCGHSTVNLKGRFSEALRGRKEGWMYEHSWNDFVVDYSSLSLTYQQDRLPAISALARRMPRNDGDEYLAGMWKSTFPLSLGWFVLPGESKRCRPPEPRPPSWSWASTSSLVSFPHYVDDDDIWIKVHDAQCTPVGKGYFWVSQIWKDHDRGRNYDHSSALVILGFRVTTARCITRIND